jgi:hypothetical protein
MYKFVEFYSEVHIIAINFSTHSSNYMYLVIIRIIYITLFVLRRKIKKESQYVENTQRTSLHGSV